jgi:hypothetical protein
MMLFPARVKLCVSRRLLRAYDRRGNPLQAVPQRPRRLVKYQTPMAISASAITTHSQ